MCNQLVLSHFFAAFQTESVSCADRQMVGGILIKQGIEIQNVRFGDRGLVRYEGNFTQVFRAFIQADQIFQ
ncbi:hypothetical protein D3C72_1982890 [compost metagenome]